MLNFLHPEIFSTVRLAARGIFAFFSEDGPLLVVKSSARMISAAKERKKIKFHFAPVFCAEMWSYCLLSAYPDNESHPLIIWTPLFDDEHSNNLLSLLQLKSIKVYFLDEKNRPWLTCYGTNIDYKKFISFSKKIELFPSALAESAHEEVIKQACDWFSSTTLRDDKRAFDLHLGEAIYGENIAIMDLTESATDFHGSVIRVSELEYQDPGQRQEPDFAEQFACLFPAEQVFLNPFKLPVTEELCDILVVGRLANYYIQLKSSPNTPAMLERDIDRCRAKSIQHLGIAISQTEKCLRHIEKEDSFEICLNRDRKFRATIEQAGRNMIFIIASQEQFDGDRLVYSNKLLDFAEAEKKIVDYVSEATLYDYLHYCKDEDDFFKLVVDDFFTLLSTRKFSKPRSIVLRIKNLRSVDLDEIFGDPDKRITPSATVK